LEFSKVFESSKATYLGVCLTGEFQDTWQIPWGFT
jgi:hypothetical protein